MTWIKICGITNLQDARIAAHAGADALGFILVPESPRHFQNPEEITRYRQMMPTGRSVDFIGVVREAAQTDSELQRTGFDGFQVYQDSRENGSRDSDPARITAFRVKDRSVIEEISGSRVGGDSHWALLDAFDRNRLGGSGLTFDWEIAREVRVRFRNVRFVLAGGLTPENVEEALEAVRPFGVDVSSGVESEPGRKDPVKVRRFIEAVRRFDRRNPGRWNDDV